MSDHWPLCTGNGRWQMAGKRESSPFTFTVTALKGLDVFHILNCPNPMMFYVDDESDDVWVVDVECGMWDVEC